MLDPDLLNVFSTVAICGLVAVANLTLASRSISAGASLAFALAFAATGLTWLLAGTRPGAGETAALNLLLINALGATGVVAMCCGFWLRSGRAVNWWFMGALAGLWLAPLAGAELLALPPGSHVPFAVLSIALAAVSAAWCIFRKHGRKNAADWALAVWLLFVLPVSAGALLTNMGAGDGDPGAVWNFYLGFLPTLFTGVGLFSLLGFTLDAAHSSSELARRDGPTGLLNGRAFDEELAMAVERASRYQRGLALILLRTDGPAGTGESLGPREADALARDLAQRLRDGTRRIDIIARTAALDFALLLPDTSAAAAAQLAQRLSTALAASAAAKAGIRSSFGVATIDDAGYEVDALLSMAREAFSATRGSAPEPGRVAPRA